MDRSLVIPIPLIKTTFDLLKDKWTVNIAGGAARDQFLGRTPNDFDMWVQLNDKEINTIDLIIKFINKKMGTHFYLVEEYIEPGYGQKPFQVYKHDTYGGIGMDIMFSQKPVENIVAEFDFGINQAWFDKEGQFRFTKQFMQDHLARVVKPTSDEKTLDPKFFDRGGEFSQRFKYKFAWHHWAKVKSTIRRKQREERDAAKAAKGEITTFKTLNKVMGDLSMGEVAARYGRPLRPGEIIAINPAQYRQYEYPRYIQAGHIFNNELRRAVDNAALRQVEAQAAERQAPPPAPHPNRYVQMATADEIAYRNHQAAAARQEMLDRARGMMINNRG